MTMPMTITRTTISNSLRRAVVLACVLSSFLWASTGTARASDDFGQIVRHIEARYHVHRNYRFLMACAGMTVKFWPGSGVKDVKIALFEDQHVLQSVSDRELDELVLAAGGWQPLVKSFSRRRGQHSYIYARTEGKDLKLLIVNVDRSETEVVQVKVDPNKLEELVNDHGGHRSKTSGDMAFN